MNEECGKVFEEEDDMPVDGTATVLFEEEASVSVSSLTPGKERGDGGGIVGGGGGGNGGPLEGACFFANVF